MTNVCVEVIPVTPFLQNCTILHPEGGGPSVLVDPGGEWPRVEEACRRLGADIEAILVTHGHIDHIGDLPSAAEATGAPSYLHREDLFLFENPGVGLMPMAAVPVPERVTYIAHGDIVEAAGMSLRVLHTPGHSPGHVCYLLELPERTILLGGDLIFMGSIGRTDIPGGDLHTLLRSVAEKIWPLPDDTEILPGHGPATTVGQEKRINPFVGEHVIGDLLP